MTKPNVGDLIPIGDVTSEEFEEHKREFNAHKAEDMPHQFVDLSTGKTYRWGLGQDSSGIYFIREEV